MEPKQFSDIDHQAAQDTIDEGICLTCLTPLPGADSPWMIVFDKDYPSPFVDPSGCEVRGLLCQDCAAVVMGTIQMFRPTLKKDE